MTATRFSATLAGGLEAAGSAAVAAAAGLAAGATAGLDGALAGAATDLSANFFSSRISMGLSARAAVVMGPTGFSSFLGSSAAKTTCCRTGKKKEEQQFRYEVTFNEYNSR